MAKEYGQTNLSDYSKNLKKDQEKRRGTLKKIFSGPLFPKGTGGVLPKYDKAQTKSKIASMEDAMIVKSAKSKKSSDKPSPVKPTKTASTNTKANGDKKPKSFAALFVLA